MYRPYAPCAYIRSRYGRSGAGTASRVGVVDRQLVGVEHEVGVRPGELGVNDADAGLRDGVLAGAVARQTRLEGGRYQHDAQVVEGAKPLLPRPLVEGGVDDPVALAPGDAVVEPLVGAPREVVGVNESERPLPVGESVPQLRGEGGLAGAERSADDDHAIGTEVTEEPLSVSRPESARTTGPLAGGLPRIR